MSFLLEPQLAYLLKMEKERGILRDAIIKVQFAPNLTEEQKLDLTNALEKVGVV